MKDHKRKSRPIAPAEVRTGDGWIEVVVPDVLGKNESHTSDKDGARHTSTATKRYRESVRVGATVLTDKARRGWPEPAWAVSGAWRLEVLGVWPSECHTMGFVCPRGDADAAIPQALDALQYAGILDNDARVIEVCAWNLFRKGVRCTVIRLVRAVDLAARDILIAPLVARVPASPEPPSTKANRRKETPCKTSRS